MQHYPLPKNDKKNTRPFDRPMRKVELDEFNETEEPHRNWGIIIIYCVTAVVWLSAILSLLLLLF